MKRRGFLAGLFAIPAAVKAIAETKANPVEVYHKAIEAAPIPDQDGDAIWCSVSIACTFVTFSDSPGELSLTSRMREHIID